jgi:hypothetical protein
MKEGIKMLKDKINLQLFAAAKDKDENEALAAALAEIEKYKQEAKEAKALANKLQEEATQRVAAVEAESVDSVDDYLNQKVPIVLFKDGDKYKDDVVLTINGERLQIQRGVQVYVKRKFLNLIENQYRQQVLAADMQTELAGEYESWAKSKGIQ